MLTREQLKEILSYDPITGIFTNLKSKGNCRLNERAGTQHKTGYRKIGIAGKLYYEHQLAWLYMTGKWPRTTMLHINKKKNENWFDNLLDIPKPEVKKKYFFQF